MKNETWLYLIGGIGLLYFLSKTNTPQLSAKTSGVTCPPDTIYWRFTRTGNYCTQTLTPLGQVVYGQKLIGQSMW